MTNIQPAAAASAVASPQFQTAEGLQPGPWRDYLRTLRRREIEILFARCPRLVFSSGLELGAGDGYQSTLLADHVDALIATDYRPEILAASPHPRVDYRVCDAEQVAYAFAPGRFDFVFSSNMLEHLPNPRAALEGIHCVLSDDGVAIHLVPSPFWKLCHLAGFYPNIVRRQARRLRPAPLVAAPPAEAPLAEAPPAEAPPAGVPLSDAAAAWDNNPKLTAPGRQGRLRRLLAPAPHGVSRSNLAEFRAFSPSRWRAEFVTAGFDVLAIRKGPVTSGYGFRLDRLRTFLEKGGLASEYLYITVKRGARPDRVACLL